MELINNYGALACLVDDFQSGDRCKTLGNILEDKHVSATKQGHPRSIAAGGEGFTQKRRICIPLMSVLGTNSDQYFPMGTDLGMRLRLTFEAPDVALVASTGFTGSLGYSLEDITYECEYLDCDPSVYNSIVEEADGILKVSATGVSNFSTTIPAGSTQNTLLIPARYSSVRNYMTIIRENATITSKLKNSNGSRTRDNIVNWVYRLAGKNYPNLPVPADEYNSAETMCEVLKCFHSLHNTQQNVAFNAANWVSNGQPLDGAFCLGIDFEEANQSALQMSGISTQSANTFLELQHSAACAASTVDTFCWYDSIIEIDTRTGECMVSK